MAPAVASDGLSRTTVAFADESQSNRTLDPNTYVLAAALCEPSATDEVRRAIDDLRARNQRKVHWRDESNKRRHAITEAIARAPIGHIVVVRQGRGAERSERRRRLCLRRLLYELDQLAIATVTFESRGRADDCKDRTMLDALRADHTVSSALRMDHQPGPADPLLWVPDVLCGAIVQDRVGDPSYLRTIQEGTDVTIIEIGPPRG